MEVKPDWLGNPNLYDLMVALTRGGHDSYAVGGCVRDAVVGVPCADIDVATDATPDRVKKLLEAKGFDMYPTGLDHGTWTARREGNTYEVTTYRLDVATDGRRATVEFAETMYQDSKRRDFTMNALYMNVLGTVYDPTRKGIEDLLAGRVRFVGCADDRCTEDYLRILRLFRFHAKYGRGPMDPEAWTAASKHRFGLAGMSGERKWSEVRKLLMVHSPMEALLEMRETMVLETLLPDADLTCMPDLMAAERHANVRPNWPRRFLALSGSEVPFPHSNAEAKYLKNLHDACGTTFREAVLTKLWGPQIAQDVWLVRGEKSKFNQREVIRGSNARLPVTAQDFMDRGVEQGPKLGQAMRSAQSAWCASDLTWDKETLLDTVGGY